VHASPPRHSARPRRHHTRQRERILAWLRASDAHPTATQVHQALLREFPRLSLGTVYRNLEVLAADGLIDEVPAAGGALRFDGNPERHHHFRCVRCQSIRDVTLPAPRSLVRRLQREHALQAESVKIEFHGLCPDCAGTGRSKRTRDRAQPQTTVRGRGTGGERCRR
jgi:Fe2+ or Zn2+ uptake regulation protein